MKAFMTRAAYQNWFYLDKYILNLKEIKKIFVLDIYLLCRLVNYLV